MMDNGFLAALRSFGAEGGGKDLMNDETVELLLPYLELHLRPATAAAAAAAASAAATSAASAAAGGAATAGSGGGGGGGGEEAGGDDGSLPAFHERFAGGACGQAVTLMAYAQAMQGCVLPPTMLAIYSRLTSAFSFFYLPTTPLLYSFAIYLPTHSLGTTRPPSSSSRGSTRSRARRASCGARWPTRPRQRGSWPRARARCRTGVLGTCAAYDC